MVHARMLIVVALATGLPICACSSGPSSSAFDGGPPPVADGGATLTQATLRANVRSAAAADVQWSQLYAMSALAGGADASVAYDELTQADEAMASQLAPFYGADQQAALASLLHTRAKLLSGIVAKLDGASVALASTPGSTNLDGNAKAIVQFFAGLAPYAFGGMQQPLDALNSATVDAITARAQGDETRAIADIDAAKQNAFTVADLIAAGLGKLFPNEIAAPTTAPAADDFGLALRSALDDHAFYFRAWMVDHVAHRDVQPELDRAVKSADDFAAAFAALYGASTTGQLAASFHDDTTDAVAFVLAAESGDDSTMNQVSTQWSADAAALTRAVAQAVPTLDPSSARAQIGATIDAERAMVTARVSSNWTIDAASYDRVTGNLTAFAGVVTGAVSRQFTSVP